MERSTISKFLIVVIIAFVVLFLVFITIFNKDEIDKLDNVDELFKLETSDNSNEKKELNNKDVNCINDTNHIKNNDENSEENDSKEKLDPYNFEDRLITRFGEETLDKAMELFEKFIINYIEDVGGGINFPSISSDLKKKLEKNLLVEEQYSRV